MTTWEDTLEHAIASFGGQTPRDQLATYIAGHHEQHPETVTALINEIANQWATGAIRSPWGVLKSRLANLSKTKPKAKASNDQERAYRRAEQWMRAAGMHYDRWSEVQDELFGYRGQLRHWPHLEPKAHDLWEQVRPVGEQLETEAEERQARYAQQRSIPRKPQAQKEAA